LAVRLVRSMNFFRVFSHEAAEPPSGPIITPRYSADGTTEKLAHSGVIFLTALVTRLIVSGVGLTPSGMSEHFLTLRSRPEMSLKRSKFLLRVGEVLKGLH
jgi:hypothetical protein